VSELVFVIRSSLTASFRDPAGSLFRHQGRILRVVNPIRAADLEPFLASPPAKNSWPPGRGARPRARCRRARRTPRRPRYQPDPGARTHRFSQLLCEWTAEMLLGGGPLTLDLAQALLADGLGLKDGTPYNVLFRGSMFRRLTRGREELHRKLMPELFGSLCRRYFDIVRAQHEEGATRWLYLLRKR
jgi:hypothetical protein